jgi:hypothetical protein
MDSIEVGNNGAEFFVFRAILKALVCVFFIRCGNFETVCNDDGGR